MKLSILGAIVLVTPLILMNPTHSAESEVDLYRFCSRFPFNSRCKGYEIPLSLEERAGDRGECLLKSNNLNLTQSNSCKAVVRDANLVVYLEEGKPLDFLDEQRATREIIIPLNKVITLDYSEYKRNNYSNFVNFGIIGGIMGAIGADQETLSEIEISFTTPLAPGVENLEFLTFVTEKETGAMLQGQLKQFTSTELPITYEQERANYLQALGTGSDNPEQLRES